MPPVPPHSRRVLGALSTLKRVFLRVSTASAVLLALTLPARAQTAMGYSQSASALSTPSPAKRRQDGASTETLSDGEVAARRDPMPWASFALRVGVAQVHAGKIDNPAAGSALAQQAAQLPPETIAKTGYLEGNACTIIDPKCRTDGRFGLHIVAAIHLGGDGFAWDLEPYFTHGASSNTVGMYTGPKFYIHVADPAYIGFGLGLRGAYVQADGWLYGADLGGRVPLHAVVYVKPNVALEFDFGIGLGVSGYMNRNVVITSPTTGKPLASAPRMTFGLARAWDLTVGVRFP